MQIILASQSPRRQELLSLMGVPFIAIASDFDEQLDDSRDPETVAIELGLGKARAVAEQHPDALVIGGDTIVSIDGRQLGKQATAAETKELLLLLAGRAHTVTSSVVLVCKNQHIEIAQADSVSVVFKAADKTAIDRYIATGDWQDKAVYGIQGGAAPLIDHIEGDYTTILGLPTQLLATTLQAQDITAHPVSLLAPVPVHATDT